MVDVAGTTVSGELGVLLAFWGPSKMVKFPVVETWTSEGNWKVKSEEASAVLTT